MMIFTLHCNIFQCFIRVEQNFLLTLLVREDDDNAWVVFVSLTFHSGHHVFYNALVRITLGWHLEGIRIFWGCSLLKFGGVEFWWHRGLTTPFQGRIGIALRSDMVSIGGECSSIRQVWRKGQMFYCLTGLLQGGNALLSERVSEKGKHCRLHQIIWNRLYCF